MSNDMKRMGFALPVLITCVFAPASLLPLAMEQEVPRPDMVIALKADNVAAIPQAGRRTYDDQYSRERPLFYVEREFVTTSSKTVYQTPSITLEGIVGARRGLSAGLRFGAQAELRWLRVGDKSGQWTVDRIDFKSVDLRNGEDVKTLRLH